MSIDIGYYSFSPSRADEKWAGFVEDVQTGALEENDALDADELIGCLIDGVCDDDYEEKRFLLDLKLLDIFYGSVRADGFDGLRIEEECLSALVFAYNLEVENNIPTRNEWVRLFENLDLDLIKKAGVYLSEKLACDESKGVLEIKNYLQLIRPVIKDLKANPDAVFLKTYDREEIAPANIDGFLSERASRHLREYKEKSPSVL
jgi:hypothetical protein